MKRNFLKYSVMTVFSILILLISSLFLGNLSTKSSIQKTRLYSSTKEYSEYKQQIQSLGGAQAYHKFKKKNQLLKTTAQHNSAHVFGEALYSSLGLKGITICDDDFNYGCYHSVIGNTLGREGLDKIEEINEECATTNEFLKCQHGIGHGIVTYLGYDSDNLKQSLEICDTLKNRDHIGGCFTGVFMEYNFQTMLSEDAKIRNFDKEAPLSPCDTLPTNFQDPCLFEQANWWLQVLPGDLTGLMVEVLVNGQFGYAATAQWNQPEQIQAAFERACRQASQASPYAVCSFTTQQRPIMRGHYQSPVQNPFSQTKAHDIFDQLLRISQGLKISDKIVKTGAFLQSL
jgi:hypothetical protein